jgi:transposase
VQPPASLGNQDWMAKNLSYKELLSNLNGLTVRNVVVAETGWVVEAEGSGSALCPDCGVTSHSRHSRYWRKLRDLPLQGASVTLKVQLGRWRCRSRQCLRQIFTERVTGVLLPHSQQTMRLSEVHRLVGRALGGRSGQRLLNRLGMPSSRHTLLRQVIQGARGSARQNAIRVVGVDDWAWRKGQSFGTILVDLERSEVVDLLPTRSARVLGEWLAQHPEVMVVSRDRQGVYAEAVRAGAPEARQVADRFHLTLNLRQAVERELAVRRPFLRLTPKSTPVLPPGRGTETEKRRGRQIQSSVQKQHAEAARLRQQQKQELFQTIQRMKNSGMKVSQIAGHLGIDRGRIDRWVRLDTLPERNRMEPRPGIVERFRGYLQQRWAAGCRHGRTLLAEIRERGYVGAFSTLAKFLSPWRQPPVKTTTVSTDAAPLEETPTAPAPRQVSPQVSAALLSKFRTELTPEQAEIVDAFKQQCPGFAVMRKLVLNFRSLLRVGKLASLRLWMKRAQKTGFHALTRFVRSLQQDLSAVEAAVTEPWSNGPVEGHINRLKMLKRQMYGRAGVELLRARLLPESHITGQCVHQS